LVEHFLDSKKQPSEDEEEAQEKIGERGS